MKTTSKSFYILCLVFFCSILNFSCKKDSDPPILEESPKAFADIQLKHIMTLESSMNSSNITVSDASGILFKTGDVFVYKSSEGHYGKFQILKIDAADNHKLTIQITNFTHDGAVLLATNSLDIRGTYLCDLDIVAETGETVTSDFHWNRLTSTNTRFDPKNGAKFAKYQFKP